jgi:hypothetical protein
MSEPIEPITRIDDELWAWITDTPEGPSIIGVLSELGHTPLVFARKRVALHAEYLARGHGVAMHQPVRLVHFREVKEP